MTPMSKDEYEAYRILEATQEEFNKIFPDYYLDEGTDGFCYIYNNNDETVGVYNPVYTDKNGIKRYKDVDTMINELQDFLIADIENKSLKSFFFSKKKKTISVDI